METYILQDRIPVRVSEKTFIQHRMKYDTRIAYWEGIGVSVSTVFRGCVLDPEEKMFSSVVLGPTGRIIHMLEYASYESALRGHLSLVTAQREGKLEEGSVLR